jgi:hypothetical protein
MVRIQCYSAEFTPSGCRQSASLVQAPFAGCRKYDIPSVTKRIVLLQAVVQKQFMGWKLLGLFTRHHSVNFALFGRILDMRMQRLTLVTLSLGTIGLSGCLRNHRNEPVVSSLEKVNVPRPPLPTNGKFAELGPAPTTVQPPKLEIAPGSVPALPGMPGTSSQPYPNSIPDGPTSRLNDNKDELLASENDDKRKGIIERLRERRLEREKKGLPELPPAIEPKKEIPKNDAEPKMMTPVIPAPPSPPPLAAPTGSPPAVVAPTPPTPPTPPTAPVASTKAEPKPTETGLKAIRTLVDAAEKRFADVSDGETKLTKRETVGGKKQPTEEIRFLFRKEPFSVRLTVTGEHGRGREVLFVKGQNAGKLVIVTGEGDNRLLGAGKKIELDPDSPLATGRTRGKIEDSGLGRPIRVLAKFLDEAEKGTRPADTVRALGAVKRTEFANAVEGVEVALRPSDDPLLPKGGKRLYYFDADPKSESYRLPVLVITYEPNDTEVEYYCFTDIRVNLKRTRISTPRNSAGSDNRTCLCGR